MFSRFRYGPGERFVQRCNCSLVLSLQLDNRVLGVFFNAAQIDSLLHEDVACASPAGSPAVAHDPVVGAGQVAVANNGDCVID